MEWKLQIVRVVIDGALALKDEDRVFRQRMDMRNIGFASLEANVIHIGAPGADAGPYDETCVLGDQRQAQSGMVTMKNPDGHEAFNFAKDWRRGADQPGKDHPEASFLSSPPPRIDSHRRHRYAPSPPLATEFGRPTQPRRRFR